MRPLELAFTGLRSYTEFGPVSFQDKTLVGILGDTGAGKSTILEALCVALYGRCSWSDRDVKDLVADGARSMSVDFTFAHDGHRWRVRRTHHMNTMPPTALLENLDTGLKIDNVRPVNEHIATMLRLDFAAFRSAVVLPQGRFMTLLHASGRDRTELLKGVFGADVVEVVRSLVTDRRTALADLVSDADVARARLRENPAVDADAAARRAEAAESRAAALTATLDQLRAAQKDAAGAHACVRAARDATKTVAGVRQTISELRPRVEAAAAAAQATSRTAGALDVREQAAAQTRERAEAALTVAADHGESLDTFARTAAVLDAAPGRVRDVTEQTERHQREAARLAGEQDRLQQAAATEPVRADEAEKSRAYAEALGTRLDDARGQATVVRDAIRDLVDAAAAATRAETAAASLDGQVSAVRDKLPALEKAVDATEKRAVAATAKLAAAQRADAAAAAGVHLHAGDACPVCTRALPAGYRPPAPADPATLHDAAAQAADAQRRAEAARGNLRDAQRRVDELRMQLQEAAERAAAAHAAVDAAHAAVAAGAEAPALTTGSESDVHPLDAAQIVGAGAEAAAASAANPDVAPAHRAATVTAAMAAVAAFLKALKAAHDAALRAENEAASKLAAHRSELAAARSAYERDADTHARLTGRLAAQWAEIAADLRALAPSVSALLPAAPPAEYAPAAEVDWTPQSRWAGKLKTALPNAVAHAERSRSALDAHRRALQQAADTDVEIARERLALRRQVDAEVNAPLREVLRDATAATRAAVDAAGTPAIAPGGTARSAGATARNQPEGDPATVTGDDVDAADPASVAVHLDRLAAYVSDTAAALTEAAAELATTAHAATIALTRDLQAALELAGGDPNSVVVPSGDALLEPTALDSITRAATVADERARRDRAEEADARTQIPRAQHLDNALHAGRVRLASLKDCHMLLSDGKFLRYLTDRRTRSLLGVASELFGRLSGGALGFAKDFQIVSRRTGVARSAKTLSGGETFLASLALALALVELYGRTGGRLGALFLDEGFGSLDVDTLTTALEVLRAESGGDKLVAVISHLHAVAEAVEDVLWVKKGPGGSSAHWLSGAETEALVRDDVAAGLLALA
jgi:DNA repair protein SbcC/Rad50